MRKTRLILIIIGALYCVIAIPLVLYYGREFIGWEAIVIAISCIFLVVFVFYMISLKKYKQIYESYQRHQLDETLLLCKKLLKWNLNIGFRQNSYYIMAVIYFERNDDIHYEAAMSHVDLKKILPLKYYWQVVAFLVNDHLVEARESYRKFLDSLQHIRKRSIYEKHETILKSIFNFIDHKDEETLFNLKDSLQKTQSPRIRTYIESLL